MFCTRRDHIREYMQLMHLWVHSTVLSMRARSPCLEHGSCRGYTHALHACVQHSLVGTRSESEAL